MAVRDRAISESLSLSVLPLLLLLFPPSLNDGFFEESVLLRRRYGLFAGAAELPSMPLTLRSPLLLAIEFVREPFFFRL